MTLDKTIYMDLSKDRNRETLTLVSVIGPILYDAI